MKHFIALLGLAVVASGKYTGPTTTAGLNLIQQYEGWYPNFYIDPVGIKTIGYGHACHVWDCSVPLNGLYTPPLTQSQGQALLLSDLSKGGYEKCVNDAVTYSGLTAEQFSALVSFAYNLGCGNLKSSTLVKLLNAGDVAGASGEFSKWVKAGGKVLPGLVKRREGERVLFCSSGGCGSASGRSAATCTGKVTATSLNVRSSPSSSGSAVASLSSGNTVTIQGRVAGTAVSGNSNWFKISQGYVSAYYIDIVTNSGDTWCSKN